MTTETQPVTTTAVWVKSENERQNLTTVLIDSISSYFLDNAGSQPWEDFDPDLDSIRSQLIATQNR